MISVKQIRQNTLLMAEAFDAWRVIINIMLLAYGYLVFNLYIWYKNIPTYVQEKCDPQLVADLLTRGKSIAEVKQFACTVIDVVGGPTTAQSTFVTTIIGLSAGIFGLYTASGRRWDMWSPEINSKQAVVSYAPSSVTTTDGQVLSVATQDAPAKTQPSIQIFTAGEAQNINTDAVDADGGPTAPDSTDGPRP